MACRRTIPAVCLRPDLCKRRCRRGVLGPAFVAAALGAMSLGGACPAAAYPVRAVIDVKATDGYARLIFKMSDDDDAAVSNGGGYPGHLPNDVVIG